MDNEIPVLADVAATGAGPAAGVIEAAARRHDAVGAVSWVRTAEGDALRPVASWFSIEGARVLASAVLPYHGSVAGEAIDTGRMQLAGAGATPFPERRAAFATLGIRTVVVVPLARETAVAFYLAVDGVAAATIAGRLEEWGRAQAGAVTS
jgi:hypothetical protein